MSEHTPTPWWMQKENGENYMVVLFAIYGDDSYKVGGTDDDSDLDRANAGFIVRACNSHDDLSAALQLMVGSYGYNRYGRRLQDTPKDRDSVRAAIAKAKNTQVTGQGIRPASSD